MQFNSSSLDPFLFLLSQSRQQSVEVASVSEDKQLAGFGLEIDQHLNQFDGDVLVEGLDVGDFLDQLLLGGWLQVFQSRLDECYDGGFVQGMVEVGRTCSLEQEGDESRGDDLKGQ